MDDPSKKAREIGALLENQPALAASLAIDFVRQFSTDEQDETDAILLKLDLDEADSAVSIKETSKRLEQLIAKVERDNSADAYLEKERREDTFAGKFRDIRIEHPVILEAESLTKDYSSTGFKLIADHLQLHLGQITGLLGENASGKTTLFNILAGDLIQTSGKLRFPLFKGGQRMNWLKLKEQIAYVPQELPAWRDSLLNTLHFEAAIHGITGKANQREVNFVIQRLGLAEHVGKSWNQLSGGYKLRFSLARALVSGAQLLLLDEPLANLDIKTQQIVLNDLYHLSHSLDRPLAVFISSQHIHEIEAVADRLYYLDNGKLEDLGPKSKYGKDRIQNLFEFSASVSTEQLVRALAGFPYLKQWSTGFTIFVTTSKEVKGEELVAHLANKGIPLEYFRDISQSVKTRFYATQLG